MSDEQPSSEPASVESIRQRLREVEEAVARREAEFDNLDRAVVAAVLARIAGDGVALHGILSCVEPHAFIEHLLSFMVVMGAAEHGSIERFGNVLGWYQKDTTL